MFQARVVLGVQGKDGKIPSSLNQSVTHKGEQLCLLRSYFEGDETVCAERLRTAQRAAAANSEEQ